MYKHGCQYWYDQVDVPCGLDDHVDVTEFYWLIWHYIHPDSEASISFLGGWNDAVK